MKRIYPLAVFALVGLISVGAYASPQTKKHDLIVIGSDHSLDSILTVRFIDADVNGMLIVSRGTVYSLEPKLPLKIVDLEVVDNFLYWQKQPVTDTYLHRSQAWIKWNNIRAASFKPATLLTTRLDC